MVQASGEGLLNTWANGFAGCVCVYRSDGPISSCGVSDTTEGIQTKEIWNPLQQQETVLGSPYGGITISRELGERLTRVTLCTISVITLPDGSKEKFTPPKDITHQTLLLLPSPSRKTLIG